MSRFKLLLSCLIISTMLVDTSSAASDKLYIINLNYDTGAISLNSVYVTVRDISIEPAQTGNYHYDVLSFENKVLFTSRFEIRTDFSVPDIESTEPIEIHLEKQDISLEIPYFENGKSIDIYDSKNNKVHSVDVGYFTDTCDNSVCEAHESYENCPKDCPSGEKDDYCDGIEDNICDPDCSEEQDVDCKSGDSGKTEDSKKSHATYYIILAIMVSVLLLFVIYKKIREKKKWKELERKYSDRL